MSLRNAVTRDESTQFGNTQMPLRLMIEYRVAMAGKTTTMIPSFLLAERVTIIVRFIFQIKKSPDNYLLQNDSDGDIGRANKYIIII